MVPLCLFVAVVVLFINFFFSVLCMFILSLNMLGLSSRTYMNMPFDTKTDNLY